MKSNQRYDAIQRRLGIVAMGANLCGAFLVLKDQIQQLRIEIDETKQKLQVAEITETEYFRQLQERVQTMRGRPKESS